MATPATAYVPDAVYRATPVCGYLPLASGKMREAIEVTIARGSVHYTHVVRLSSGAAEPTAEHGMGTLSGQKLERQGTCKSAGRAYQATYSGTCMRRSAELKGMHTRTEGGETISRECPGSIKRPLKPLLPKEKKPAS